ncbi:MAG TPA: tyrosine--tRNA ligase [Acholeplasmataceae bacterium]|nr:tyrosine--tRNA ligase [Acholeplasmataceae bacterium]
MGLYEELQWRGLVKDISHEERAMEMLNNDNIRFYCGFDPTGQSLTIGHLVQIVRMKLLQQYGHTPVVLIGGATGLIGDPRESGERTMLTLEQSLYNAKMIENQINNFLDKDEVIYVNNNDWIKDIDMITFLRDYGKNFNVSYMLAKENVQSRLQTGISYTEFSYMIIQAIDFLHLYENFNVKLQFGGSDQWGNITTGLELIRKVKGENDAFGMSSPLLLKSDGTKFGKSEGGALWLDRKLTTPYEIYQYFLNTSDDDVPTYLKNLTLLKKDEIIALENSIKKHPELRLAQKRLAEEVVIFMHGKEALKEALAVTEALFTNDFNNLNKDAFKSLENTLDNTIVAKEITLMQALINLKLASSNREAREFINNGAVYINGVKVEDIEYVIKQELALFDKYFIIRRGRKKSALLIMED